MSIKEVPSRTVFGVLLLTTTLGISLFVWRTFLSTGAKQSSVEAIDGDEEIAQESKRHSSDRRRMRFLENRIRLLEHKMADMEQKLTRCQNDSSKEIDEDDNAETTDWDEENGALDNPGSHFASVMVSENIDYDWRERIEAQFDRLAYDNRFSGASLMETDCRESLCRISIEYDDLQSRENALSDLGFLAAAGEELITAMKDDTPGQTDAYLRRSPPE